MLKESGWNVLAADCRHSARSPTLDAIEAASETLFDPRCLDRIRSFCKSLRQQAQFFRAKTVTFTFQDGEFRGLDGDLFPGWLACHDPTAGERLPHEPVIDCQCALDHLGSF